MEYLLNIKTSVFMHGPRKLSSYYKTLVLIFYCTKNKLVLINIFKTDIPRQREEYEVIYGTKIKTSQYLRFVSEKTSLTATPSCGARSLARPNRQ